MSIITAKKLINTVTAVEMPITLSGSIFEVMAIMLHRIITLELIAMGVMHRFQT